MLHLLKNYNVFLTVTAGVTLTLGFLGDLTGALTDSTARILYLVAYLSGGYSGVVESARALRNFNLNVDVLMIAAALGAAAIGEFLEGAVLLFLFSLSNTLQEFALGKSRREVKSLLKLRPEEALVRDDDGTEEYRKIDTLQKGDLVIVKPGERMPVDGLIVAGTSTIDQSAITGESLPVEKTVGEEVFAATLNENGVLEITVSKTSGETMLSKIIDMVERAQGNKAATQRFLDNFESRYAYGVILFVAGLILIPWLFLDSPFDDIFYQAMTILVVASPCALVISTPASVLSAIANAARNGVLFKGGAYLEQAANIKAIAFDKTGTLTLGKLKVTDVVPFENGSVALSEEELLSLAASAEKYSEHHLASAILDEATERNLELIPAYQVSSEAGKGISAMVAGKKIQIGNEQLFRGSGEIFENGLREKAEKLKSQNKSVLYIVANEQPVGLIALTDRIRPESRQVVKKLKEIGISRMVMLTGDAREVALAIASDLNIQEYHAGLLPDEKVDFIKKLAAEYPTAMVGDGVNDAPALASAHLGIAMGTAGTDVALETADVVLMSDDLNKIPYLLQLAQKTKKVVWQNIIFSLAVIVGLVLSVFFFDLPLPVGVVGHEGSTVIVVFNGLRLLRDI